MAFPHLRLFNSTVPDCHSDEKEFEITNADVGSRERRKILQFKLGGAIVLRSVSSIKTKYRVTDHDRNVAFKTEYYSMTHWVIKFSQVTETSRARNETTHLSCRGDKNRMFATYVADVAY